MTDQKDTYYTVHKFMIRELKLSGTELLTFALIYSFFCTDERCFRGSLNYIAENIAATKRSVTNAIKSLTNKKLIEKETSDKGQYPLYKITEYALNERYPTTKDSTEEVNFFHPTEENFSSPQGKNFTTPTKNFHHPEEKFSPNNKEDNKYYNKADNSAHGGARGGATNKEFKGNGGYNGGYYSKGGNGNNNGGFYNKKGWCSYDDGNNAEYWLEAFNTALESSYADD